VVAPKSARASVGLETLHCDKFRICNLTQKRLLESGLSVALIEVKIRLRARSTFRFNALMTATRANIVGPSSVATRIRFPLRL
jgi:hypothetical protein